MNIIKDLYLRSIVCKSSLHWLPVIADLSDMIIIGYGTYVVYHYDILLDIVFVDFQ